ncbi:TOG array regulator of axonemal microtubules protein 1-like [Hoplias malabaricus]|uniref:TOG array regulator of axonemal microtubules protein 1-like n=1 Tax=Hoplias malabaricus TaxID=27720 RepID=UPI0034635D70
MIYGLIPPETHAQLLDHENFQNRTNAVEELKNILSDMDLKTVSSDSIVEFIHFIHRLLDDTNFKVLYGTLQIINLLVQKLDSSVDRYYKQIVFVTLKTLGDTRTFTRNEYMNIFRQLMRIIGPQKILELVVGHLMHKNSRVREDVINIITGAMLTHPRKDFNIPDLCFVVAPYLADSKKRVRHAALELFAVFDYCLGTGKKQPLMKAINRVELTGHMDGLMAAVQARRARHILPRLSADGMVEYALVIPKPGQRNKAQSGSGADLDWVLHGGRVNSARSLCTEMDTDDLSGYGSVGSLTDDLPLHRRIVSAGKWKNKLPWERSSLACTVNMPLRSAPNGKSPDKLSIEDLTTSKRLNQQTCVTNFGSVEHLQSYSPAWRKETMGRLCRSGSLDLDCDVFKAASTSDAEKGLPKSIRLLSGNSSVERTFSLPHNSTLPGSFLLPSYPLATLPGVQLTPTLSRRSNADPSLSMFYTWPNKEETGTHHKDSSQWKDSSGERSSSKFLPLSTHTSEGSAPSASLPHALSTDRSSPIFPVTQQSMQEGYQQDQPGRNLYLDLTLMTLQDPDEEPVDREEMLKSLRSLRNSAAKKRARVSLSGSEPDPDSPDSAIKLEQTLPSHTSRSVTSPLSESNLCSPSTPIANGTKSCPGSASITRVPSGKKWMSSVEASFQGSHPGEAACPEQEDSMSKIQSDSPAGKHGSAVSFVCGDSDKSPEPEESVERVKLPRFTMDKMHQHCLQRQEAQPTQNERQYMGRTRQRLKHVVSEVGTGETAPLKDVQSKNNGVASAKTETPKDDLTSSLTRVQTTQSPVSYFSPHHQPSPPTAIPVRHTLPRQRRATSLNRARPSLSNSSDEFTPGTVKMDFHEQHDQRPFSKPDLVLMQCFRLLNLDDWEKKIEGLTLLRSLAQYHSDVLISRLHDVCFILIQEVRNLRSGVSRMAVVTLGELYSFLQKGMDQELEATAKALLHKAGESSAFIRQDVDAALNNMVQNCTPTRSMNALITGGLGHLNAVVRKCSSQHLATLVEKIGAARLLSGTKDLTDRILPAISKLVQDSSQEARYFGRQMLMLLSSHHDFDKMAAKYIPGKDLANIRDTVLTLKTKGLGEMPQDTPSARGRRALPGGGLVRASSLTREPQLSLSKDKAQTQSIADKTEYINQLQVLLSSKDFRGRIKGIDQLVKDCEDNPYIIVGNMFPIFDAFKSRLQESNSKVNLYALEALQRIIILLGDNLAQVIHILVPSIVDNHLNSKNAAIYMAATGAIQTLIRILDNTLLLQPLCTKAQFLSGKAKVDLVDKVAELVKELYPRKPQLVEQKVLPLLWQLLGTSSNSGTLRGRGGSLRGATTNLCQALHMHMGSALMEHGASQPSNIYQNLNEFLKNLPKQ